MAGWLMTFTGIVIIGGIQLLSSKLRTMTNVSALLLVCLGIHLIKVPTKMTSTLCSSTWQLENYSSQKTPQKLLIREDNTDHSLELMSYDYLNHSIYLEDAVHIQRGKVTVSQRIATVKATSQTSNVKGAMATVNSQSVRWKCGNYLRSEVLYYSSINCISLYCILLYNLLLF